MGPNTRGGLIYKIRIGNESVTEDQLKNQRKASKTYGS